MNFDLDAKIIDDKLFFYPEVLNDWFIAYNEDELLKFELYTIAGDEPTFVKRFNKIAYAVTAAEQLK